MSARPICAAAPSAVSQSPPPQSHAALTRHGSCDSSSLTRSRSPCALPTNACTNSAEIGSFVSIGVLLSFQRRSHTPCITQLQEQVCHIGAGNRDSYQSHRRPFAVGNPVYQFITPRCASFTYAQRS